MARVAFRAVAAASLFASVAAQPSCDNGEAPQCPDGSAMDMGSTPPCSGGPPECADGTVLTPPGGGGGGAGAGGAAPGGAPGGGGESCTTSGNFASNDLTFNAATGKFSGTMVTNQCPSLESSWERKTADCVAQTIPDPGFTSSGAIPLLGRAGLTLQGVNIYSPYEAGFGTSTSEPPPFPCEDLDQDMDQDGYCQGGLDVKTCEDGLHFACGGEATLTAFFLDACGGHATPYHMHHHPSCDYDETAAGHSPLVGIALDGYGHYGLNEDGEGNAPTLDACNGHTAPIPVNADMGITEVATVYHYHFTAARPFTLGCFGPVDSLAACKALYPDTCNDEFVLVPTDAAGASDYYDLFCPCYQHGGSEYEGAFQDAATALGMTATAWAVQGVNDGTAASRAQPSSSAGNAQTLSPSGSVASDQCTAQATPPTPSPSPTPSPTPSPATPASTASSATASFTVPSICFPVVAFAATALMAHSSAC